MKNEHQQLYNVMRNFEGMQKIEAFDLLHRMEILLFYAKSPLRSDHLKQIITADMDRENNVDVDPFQFTILPNGNFCEFIGSNDWIHIYKETKRGLSVCNPFARYYFKTKYAPLELLKLTKNNLLENVAGTSKELTIEDFLRTNTVAKKNPEGRLRVLDI